VEEVELWQEGAGDLVKRSEAVELLRRAVKKADLLMVEELATSKASQESQISVDELMAEIRSAFGEGARTIFEEADPGWLKSEEVHDAIEKVWGSPAPARPSAAAQVEKAWGEAKLERIQELEKEVRELRRLNKAQPKKYFWPPITPCTGGFETFIFPPTTTWGTAYGPSSTTSG
jgi:hypothetical protein